MLCWIVLLEGAFMAPSCLVALIYGERREALIYLSVSAVLFLFGFLLTRKKSGSSGIYQRDGMVIVGLGWILFCCFGALPFVLCREIPFYIDALFETVSGFTTTGASILPEVEKLSHASLFWRSFTHWVGGMGVLVFLLMFIPVQDGSHVNLMKAESPGPDVSKFVPRVRQTASLLYRIYIFMTLLEILFLLLSGMGLFDAFCISFGTAGTGGFTVLNSGMASYTPLQHWIVAVFMMLFGVNFSFYYLIRSRKVRQAVKMEEVRIYFIIIAAATLLTALFAGRSMDGPEPALRHAFFQVSSIITTTGYATADFNLWPSFVKTILVALMFIGACAGSTGGGLKVSRILILFRAVRRELYQILHPRSVKKVRVNGQPVSDNLVRTVLTFFSAYLILFAVSVLLLSLNGAAFETNFTAAAATLNNIGPGLGPVGPMGNYAFFSPFSKLVLIFDMLAGRLELYPILLLLLPGTWRRRE